MEERLLLDRIALHAADVAERDAQLAALVEAHPANAVAPGGRSGSGARRRRNESALPRPATSEPTVVWRPSTSPALHCRAGFFRRRGRSRTRFGFGIASRIAQQRLEEFAPRAGCQRNRSRGGCSLQRRTSRPPPSSRQNSRSRPTAIRRQVPHMLRPAGGRARSNWGASLWALVQAGNNDASNLAKGVPG